MSINRNISRGDIYYVDYAPTVGSEQHSGRPAIVVSNDTNNKFSEVVEVVYLTTQAKNDLPTHIDVSGLTKPSTALCEQITTVSKSRLGSLAGVCTDEEMDMIDRALAVSLDISKPKQWNAVPDNTNQRYADSVIVPYNGKKCSFNACDISALIARLEVYKELYEAQMEVNRNV